MGECGQGVKHQGGAGGENNRGIKVLKVTETDTNVIYRKFNVSEISELLR